MSQMPRQTALPTCPSCAEPLDAGDRFCGACGYDLSAVPPHPADNPTLTMNGTEVNGGAVPGVDTDTPTPGAGVGTPAPGAAVGTPVPGAVPGASVPGAVTGAPVPNVVAGTSVPGQGNGGAPVPSAVTGTSVPGQGIGGAPVTGSHTSGASSPGSGFGGAPLPGADVTGAPMPGAPFSGVPTPRADTGGTPAPGSPFSGAPLPGPDAGGGHLPPPASAAAHLPPDSPEPPGGGPVPPPPPGTPVSGVRFDRPAEPEEYPLQAPDPRVAAEAAVVAESAKVCVACRAGRVDDDGYCENCGHAQPRERDHMEQESGAVAAVSDRGLRHHRNEDAFGIGHTALPDGSPALVAIVCDGVSSATRPDDASLAASRAASQSLLTALPQGTHPQQAMHEAIVAASHAVNALAAEPATAREHAPHQNAPACTLVGAVVTAGLLVVGWVGDSRVYWVPADRTSPPARLTEDDSWAAQMVAAGLMNEAEAYADDRAHAITGWLGADAYELEPHTASFKPDRPGAVVVCTDGLWNYAEAAEEMAEALPLDAAVRPLHGARVLVGHALDGGGHDNVTVAVLPFPAPAQGAGSA